MRVGLEIAQQDIDNCMERAKATSTESGTDSSQNAAAGAATSSVVGAAAGGAGGAVFGQAGQGAAAGAVGGVVGSLTQALIQALFRPKRLRHPLGSSWIVAFVKRLRACGMEIVFRPAIASHGVTPKGFTEHVGIRGSAKSNRFRKSSRNRQSGSSSGKMRPQLIAKKPKIMIDHG